MTLMTLPLRHEILGLFYNTLNLLVEIVETYLEIKEKT